MCAYPVVVDDPVCVEQAVAARLRVATLGLALLSMMLVVVLLHRAGIRADLSGTLASSVALATLFATGLAARHRLGEQCRIAAISTALGALLVVSLGGAIKSLLVLRWGAPQADELLAAADSALGIDVVAVIEAFAVHRTLTQILSHFYSTSILLLLLSVLVVGALGHLRLMWRTCLIFVGSLITTCLVSGLFPAKGAFVAVSQQTIGDLPPLAGTYAFAAFEHFYRGEPEVLALDMLTGVACFPSFHTIAALIMVQLWWGWRWVRAPLSLWCAIVVVSTIPIGGHYIIDLAAGAITFLLWSRLAKWVEVRQPVFPIVPARDALPA